MDMSETEERYKFTPGNPAYSRRVLLRLVIMASVIAVWSSRNLAKLARENVVYMYLAGNDKPDFRTICNFKRECKGLLEETFKKTVVVAKAAGIVTRGHISTDGTKLKANASKKFTLSKAELEEIRKMLERGIAVDEEEDQLYGDKRGDELPPELDTREKIRRKIEEYKEASGKSLKRAAKQLIEQYELGDERQKEKILEKLDKAEEEITKSEQRAVSLSDPEARFMKSGQRTELAYNGPSTVDHDSGIILANDVTPDCTDRHQLQPQIELTEKNLGSLPEGTKVSSDNGYFSGENLRYLEQRGLNGYIPDSKQAQEQKRKKVEGGPYAKDKFAYDVEKDQFRCPNGEFLSRTGEYEYKGKRVYVYYGANCRDCPFRRDCARKNQHRVILSDEYEAERRRMAAKMRTAEGKEEYGKRKETVEWPFGNIKHNMKFRGFLTRGTGGVRIEYNLVCTAHNLKVLWGRLGKSIPDLGKMRCVSVSVKNIGASIVTWSSKVCGFIGLSCARKLRVCSQE